MKTLIRPNGTTDPISGPVTLKHAQLLVDGYIEFVALKDEYAAKRMQLIVNEEGLLKDLPVNLVATEYINPNTLCMGGIRGNAILLTDDDRMD